MARTQTAADERTRQNHELVAQVSAETGGDVTVRQAVKLRRAARFMVRDITDEHLWEVADDDTNLLGVVAAQIKDFRVQPGGYATLTLATNDREYGQVVHKAAAHSDGHLLVAVLYTIPKPVTDEDDDG